MKTNCGSCKWSATRKNPNGAALPRLECFFNPPTVVRLNALTYAARPEVKPGDFCHNFATRRNAKKEANA